MHSRVPVHVALAVVGGAFATNSWAAAPAQIEAELRKLDAGWERAVAAKDLEKVLSFYADDASGLYDGRPIVTGKAAMRELWQQILARPDLDLHWTPTHIEVAKSADLAYDVGTIAMAYERSQGEHSQLRGQVCSGLEEDNGWAVAGGGRYIQFGPRGKWIFAGRSLQFGMIRLLHSTLASVPPWLVENENDGPWRSAILFRGSSTFVREARCLELIRQAIRLLGKPADDVIRLRRKYILACELATRKPCYATFRPSRQVD
jgi:ketosteroid isomerase-like protein